MKLRHLRVRHLLRTETQWDRISDIPLTILSFLFVIAWSWEVIGNLTGWTYWIAESVAMLAGVAWLVDFIVRFNLGEKKSHRFFVHLIEFVCIIIAFYPPFHLLRLVSIFLTIRRDTELEFRGKVVAFIIPSTILMIWCTAIAMLSAERGGTGQIQDIGTAIWWVFTTLSTVGYGDSFPVTIMGRGIAILTMVYGITLLSIVTATLASWIVSQVNSEAKEMERKEEEAIKITNSELTELKEKVAALHDALIVKPQEIKNLQKRTKNI